MARKITYYVIQIHNAYLAQWEDTSRCALTTPCLNKATRFESKEAAMRVADKVYIVIDKDHDVSVFSCQFERVIQHRKVKKKGYRA